MAEFALLVGGELKEFRHLPERPPHIPHKQVEWYSVVREYGEPFQGVEDDVYVIRTVDPATLPPPVPARIAARQARLVLLAAGKLNDAEAAVAAADQATRIEWEFATELHRSSERLIALAASIGINSATLDQMFIDGAKL